MPGGKCRPSSGGPPGLALCRRERFIAHAGYVVENPTMSFPEPTNANKNHSGSKWGIFSMKKMIPIKKQTKKNQKSYYDQKRGTWGNVDPVSRVIESKKTYKRNRDKRKSREIYGTEVW